MTGIQIETKQQVYRSIKHRNQIKTYKSNKMFIERHDDDVNR